MTSSSDCMSALEWAVLGVLSTTSLPFLRTPSFALDAPNSYESTPGKPQIWIFCTSHLVLLKSVEAVKMIKSQILLAQRWKVSFSTLIWRHSATVLSSRVPVMAAGPVDAVVHILTGKCLADDMWLECNGTAALLAPLRGISAPCGITYFSLFNMRVRCAIIYIIQGPGSMLQGNKQERWLMARALYICVSGLHLFVSWLWVAKLNGNCCFSAG